MVAAGLPVAAQPAANRPVQALAAGTGQAWSNLSAAQRDVLAPLARDWAGIDEPGKAKWLELAARYPKMFPDEQQRLRERMAEWARMTPAERGRARLSFQETRGLSRDQKQSSWDAYTALPEDERKALAERNRSQAERPKAPPSGAALPLAAALPKQNKVPSAAASAPLVKAVTPTLVQAKPGATTLPMTKTPSPPPHQRPGQPKITAAPAQVNPDTLLPVNRPRAPGSAAQQP
jgi:Protein of unknown function (DUF3106)